MSEGKATADYLRGEKDARRRKKIDYRQRRKGDCGEGGTAEADAAGTRNSKFQTRLWQPDVIPGGTVLDVKGDMRGLHGRGGGQRSRPQGMMLIDTTGRDVTWCEICPSSSSGGERKLPLHRVFANASQDCAHLYGCKWKGTPHLSLDISLASIRTS